MNNKNIIVTNEIAKAAKERGFTYESEDVPKLVYQEEELIESINRNTVIGYILAPTYHQLIDWVFNNIKDDNPNEASIRYDSKYLKYWYNILKDCPLKYEFRGRLLKWFRNKGYRIFESLIVASSAGNMFDFRIVKGKEELDRNSNNGKTYEESLNKAILRTFELLEHE